MILRIAFFLFLPALAFCHPLKINILFWNNGVGLTSDFKILEQALTKQGHQVRPIDIKVNQQLPSIPAADVNIFIEHLFEPLFRFASLNYYIPNPEWCVASEQAIRKMDLILCRTKEVERIFNKINPNTYFLGFTSIDRYDPQVPKNFSHFFHLRGQSKAKGTESILNLWRKNSKLPPLYLLSYNGTNYHLPHIKLIDRYVCEKELTTLVNSCGIHLCPSETEGFGHSLSEAMSSGALVITVDAPPMNEFITDPRCLVKYNKTTTQKLATNYFVDPGHLEKVVETIGRLPQEEIKKMGEENRRHYLANKQDFLDRLFILFQ